MFAHRIDWFGLIQSWQFECGKISEEAEWDCKYLFDKHCCITHTKKGEIDTFKTALKINSEWLNLPPNNWSLVEQGISRFGWILARSGWNLVQFQELKCNFGADLSVWIHISTNDWALQDQNCLRSVWGVLYLACICMVWVWPSKVLHTCFPVTSGKMGFLSTS